MLVQELCDRYGLSSRKSLYSRLNALEIDLGKDSNNRSYATPEQIKKLDDLDRHLKEGGTLKNFVVAIEPTVELHTPQLTTRLTTQHEVIPYPEEVTDLTTQTTQLTQHTPLTAELLGDIVAKVAEAIEPKDPLYYMVILERAIANQWVLSTSEVEKLIKVRPYIKKESNIFMRGCFCFTKCGKIGSEIGWKVSKMIDNVSP
jgi:hypothetical protein